MHASSLHSFIQWLRHWRCELSWSHRWPEHPQLIGTRTVQTCLRCGKTIERDWR